MARRLKRPIQYTNPFKVTTGNGEKLACDQVCMAIQIEVQGSIIVVDLYLISMDSSNVVLGTQWIKKFGPILSYYEKLPMSIKLDSKTITWH